MTRVVGTPGSPLRLRRITPWVRGVPALAVLAALIGALAGCAPATTNTRPVPIDSRPTPPQPEATGTAPSGSTTTPPTEAHKPEPVTEASIAADTLQTHATLERCARRKLLPEQESTVEAVRGSLDGVRTELLRGDLARASSFARQARQLARSLNCP